MDLSFFLPTLGSRCSKLPSDDGIVPNPMSATQQPASIGRKLGLWIGILLVAITAFVVVMCTAGTPKALTPPADFQAPNN